MRSSSAPLWFMHWLKIRSYTFLKALMRQSSHSSSIQESDFLKRLRQSNSSAMDSSCRSKSLIHDLYTSKTKIHSLLRLQYIVINQAYSLQLFSSLPVRTMSGQNHLSKNSWIHQRNKTLQPNLLLPFQVAFSQASIFSYYYRVGCASWTSNYNR